MVDYTPTSQEIAFIKGHFPELPNTFSERYSFLKWINRAYLEGQLNWDLTFLLEQNYSYGRSGDPLHIWTQPKRSLFANLKGILGSTTYV